MGCAPAGSRERGWVYVTPGRVKAISERMSDAVDVGETVSTRHCPMLVRIRIIILVV